MKNLEHKKWTGCWAWL